jgi:two-component system sensor histidine kinase and response regulator WspE
MSNGLEDFSLFDLFRLEAEEQVHVLQAELLQIESSADTAVPLEALMRAAHSLKGAARIIGLDVIVRLTHAMEDRLVAAQAGNALDSEDVDRLLAATDWLARLKAVPEAEVLAWLEENTPAIDVFTATFSGTGETGQESASTATPIAMSSAQTVAAETPQKPAPQAPPTTVSSRATPEHEEGIFAQFSPQERAERERTVRIAADRFDHIVSLASELLVASRKLATQGEVLERNRHAIARALHLLEDANGAATRIALNREMERQIASLATHIEELDLVSRANERTAEELHRTVLAGRLRPFSEGIVGTSRLVRDTARDLGKLVHLEVKGERVRVDRDILERLESPISHLISNAIDHGIETPGERLAAGKPAEANLRLHARHENGRLVITVRDDGRGIRRDQLRDRIVQRALVTADTAAGLADSELLEFLFLPGFSTQETVSAISGRGVGLNVVQSMVQEAGGSVTVTSEPNTGTVFRLTLPVTRSVLKVIRFQVEAEFYAVPLVRIDRVSHLEPIANSTTGETDGASTHAAVEFDGERLPLMQLSSLLGLSSKPLPAGPLPMLLCGGIAFAVDRLVDEIELPVRRLDSRLGKIPGVSAASLDENGLPLLILDMEDLIQTARGRPTTTASTHGSSLAPHILIVDDSHTVREMERRLLTRAGYTVTTAQNGQEAWNLLRLNDYDLLVSDVDMPQMNGIELVTKLRESPRLARMPVIILSYKDREEDRRRGLEAGADFYLTKGDFQNDAFRQAVVDLIGTAEPLASGDSGPS